MSGDATAWTWRHSPYKGAAFAVHLAIADVVNDMHGNEFWAANATLCAKARVGRQRCNEVLGEMVADGYLEVLSRPRNGAHEPVRYRFLTPASPVAWAAGKPRPVASGDRSDSEAGTDLSPQATGAVAVDDRKLSPEATQTKKGTQPNDYPPTPRPAPRSRRAAADRARSARGDRGSGGGEGLTPPDVVRGQAARARAVRDLLKPPGAGPDDDDKRVAS